MNFASFKKSMNWDDGHIPIWFMRQAGRYLPEYRYVRAKFPSFIDFCLTSDVATEITLQPLNRFDLDAAIIFADILILPYAMGVKVEFVEGKGPILDKFMVDYSLEDFLNYPLNIEVISKIAATVRKTKNRLDDLNIKNKATSNKKALIGFAGGPWTVFCYMVEGSGSGGKFHNVRRLLYENRDAAIRAIDHLTNATIIYLLEQIKSGADIIKIFESWASVCPSSLFDDLVIKPTSKIVNAIKSQYPNVPIIGFPKSCGIKYVDYATKSSVDVIALDEQLDLHNKNFINLLKNHCALQGNLDNILLTARNVDQQIISATKDILSTLYQNNPNGFIFNAGHGLLPETNIDNIILVIETIRKYQKQLEIKKWEQ